LIGCLVAGGCLALSRGRDLLAATAFGFAAACKCTPLLWAPYLVWRGRWKPALLLLVVALGANLLPELISRPPDGGTWLQVWATRYLRPLAAPDRYPGTWGSDVLYNQSIAGAGQRWLVTQWEWTPEGVRVTTRPDAVSPGQLQTVVRGVEAALIGLSIVALARSRATGAGHQSERNVYEYGVVLALMLLLSPMSSKPHFGTLLIPGFALARLAVSSRRRGVGMVVALAATAALVSNKDLIGAGNYTLALWYGSVTAVSVALFFGCATTLIRIPASAAARGALARAA
jgi:hypothetical protein